ncbi:MAG TPA: penicillin-binding transpeptidase domain-containing protein [Bacteriovoracaceae bacterium]|nr:penicillin-binding transpeptidase domain-containing protein [Bacteriovoracaceae bacterium]
MLIYDVDKKNFVEEINPHVCQRRLPAASTFKVPLSVMAFDSKVLKNKSTLFKWDGTKHSIEPWNKDHTAESWMRDSVVWVSQEITPQIGEEKMKDYLRNFKYGNEDLSGGLKYAWLTTAPFINEPMRNSLKISGAEQVRFLEMLWQRELNATITAQNTTLEILASEKTPKNFNFRGKTGSGFQDPEKLLRIGWFVGYLNNKEKSYIIVSNFTDTKKQMEVNYGGKEAREFAVKKLQENNLW